MIPGLGIAAHAEDQLATGQDEVTTPGPVEGPRAAGHLQPDMKNLGGQDSKQQDKHRHNKTIMKNLGSKINSQVPQVQYV